MSYERVVSVSSTVVESPVGNGGHVGLGGFVGHDCFSVSLFSLCVFCRMIYGHGQAWLVGLGFCAVVSTSMHLCVLCCPIACQHHCDWFPLLEVSI